MRFERERALKNNIFSTKITRVEDECEESVRQEEILEDDFGYVEIQVGGTFNAIIAKDEFGVFSMKPVTSEMKAREVEQANFKFSLPATKVKLVMGAEIPFICDSLKETDREFEGHILPAKKVAEFKCKMFEEIILDRAKVAIKEWKDNLTSFETEELDPVHFDLVEGINPVIFR